MSHTCFRVNLHSIVATSQGTPWLKPAWYLKHNWQKQDLNSQPLKWSAILAKWLSVCLQTKWSWDRILFLSCNLKMCNISVTPRLVKKVIINLGLLNVSGVDCIPVVVLKNCEPELSCVLGELFRMCLKEFWFPDCWKSHWWALYLRTLGNALQLKNSVLVFSLWSVKSLKNL